jgi:hypothetical protein
VEVTRFEKTLAWNWPIGICLHSVRTSSWSVPTMSILMKISIPELAKLATIFIDMKKCELRKSCSKKFFQAPSIHFKYYDWTKLILLCFITFTSRNIWEMKMETVCSCKFQANLLFFWCFYPLFLDLETIGANFCEKAESILTGNLNSYLK